MENEILLNIRSGRDTSVFGNKGLGLHWLARHNFNIPETLVLTYAGTKILNQHPDRFRAEIAGLIAQRTESGKTYAVRSSANLEDGAHLSFAGQFTTKTNVQGMESILASIQEVMSSVHSPALQSYFRKLGGSDKDLEMAVLIQEMVTPELSGVAFSKNPTTGLDEVVIEAVQGLGETLMQEGVTPDRWIFRWGQFTTRPEEKNKFDDIVREIAVETRRIARLHRSPVDLEWVYDGQKIYWLQIRPITMLTSVPLYSNRIAREVLPGIIKPLISSVNIPLVNTAWIRLFDQLLGPTHLKPEELTRIFFYRAYFNMGSVGTIFEKLGFPRESLEMLLGFQVKSERPRLSWRTLRHLPRMLRFAIRAWNYDRGVAAELRAFEETAQEMQQESLEGLSEIELVKKIESLFKFNVLVAYENIVIPLLMNLFNALLNSQLQRQGIDYVIFDVTAGMEDIGKYDPNVHLNALKETFEHYQPALQEEIRSRSYQQLLEDPRFAEFSEKIDLFIQLFGHLSESGNDFSRKPWRENPDTVVHMAINHNPSDRDGKKITWESLRISRIARWLMKPIYTRARRFRFRREQISSIYTLSYGWFRVIYSSLAARFVEKGAIQSTEEIFYLTSQEVQALATGTGDTADFRARIEKRRQEIEESRDALLPDTIYGNVPPPVHPGRGAAQKRTGIPTSPGYYQGRLTVVESTDDFAKVQPGDVIAIPYSDVAWTPLFARAGAVVAEAGGILSHSSIVAREYGIPCVVSINGATTMPENSIVFVNGYQGEVTLISQAHSTPKNGREQ